MVYWAMMLTLVFSVISPIRADKDLQRVLFWLTGLVLIILIGYRHEVGGDWFRYVSSSYGIAKGVPFDFSTFYTGDYGYRLVHWFSVNHLNGIYGTNLIISIFFVSGLIRFCRALPMPWLALLTSIPFLVIVVSMGYSRQAAAVGIFMWALVDLMQGKNIRFYVYVIFGSLFHFTVLFMLPVIAIYTFSFKRSSFFTLIVIFVLLILALGSAYILLSGVIERMIYYYITIKFHHSGGAIARVFVSFVASILFLIYRKELKEKYSDTKLWMIFSIVSILLLPASFFYSTVVDRVAIYFIPLQMVVFSRVSTLIKSTIGRAMFVFGVVISYVFIMALWLEVGNFSSHWVPYQNLLTY
jgi:hypothetical protein